MALSITSLFTIETAVTFLAKGLQVATALGLPVTSWYPGDPTLSVYHYLAEVLATREDIQAEYIKAGFLDDASGDWLTVVAKQVYNVDRGESTAAADTLTLTNSSSGLYYTFDPGDLSFKSSVTNKTYRSTTAVTLGPGETDSAVGYVADEAGSDSSAGVDEIDTLLTSANDLSITASNASLGTDKQEDEPLRELCRASLGALSPNGPADAYEYVAKSSALTGSTEVTKTYSDGDTDTGDVTLYVAGSTGAVTGGAVTAVSDAVAQWSTPLCVTPSVQNATEVPVTVTMTVYVRATIGISTDDIEEAIEDAIAALFASTVDNPIGGNDGKLHAWLIAAAARDTYPDYVFNVAMSSPAADVTIATGEVATLAATPTVTAVLV